MSRLVEGFQTFDPCGARAEDAQRLRTGRTENVAAVGVRWIQVNSAAVWCPVFASPGNARVVQKSGGIFDLVFLLKACGLA